jgi:hypothetical protein
MYSQLNDKYAEGAIECVAQKKVHKALITYI